MTGEGILSWTNERWLEIPALLDLTGPDGPQGEKGKTDDAGPKGDKGDPGAACTLTGSHDANITSVRIAHFLGDGADLLVTVNQKIA